MTITFVHETVSVGPTSTVMATVDIRDTRTCAVAVKNTDASQTLDVTLRRRCDSRDDFAPTNTPLELEAILPGEQRACDIDVGVHVELEVLGVASGAGLDAVITVKPDYGRRP